jgi:phosphotransferase system  glucose/maltose/N-acetylglucosamine-specific IIC component
VKESKANQYYKKYGWLIGIAGIVYGLFFSAGITPFLIGVTQTLKQNGNDVALKSFLVVPFVIGVFALALITGSIIFLVRYLKKYPRHREQDAQDNLSG